MEIYAHAREVMAKSGNPRQWGQTCWPPRDLIAADIAAGRSYVLEEEGVIGAVFCFMQGEDIEPCYNDIDGHWIGSGAYGVVHRIAASGAISGAGQACIRWAYSQCGDLRMDTHTDNRIMQHLFDKLGFVRCGVIHVEEDNDPRYAYEKLPESTREQKPNKNAWNISGNAQNTEQ